MRIGDLLALSTFQGTTLVAGAAGLEREVTWAHVVDVPEPASWIGAGQLLLTTGYAWPRETEAEREQIEALAARGLAGIGLAVPGYAEHFRKLPKTPQNGSRSRFSRYRGTSLSPASPRNCTARFSHRSRA